MLAGHCAATQGKHAHFIAVSGPTEALSAADPAKSPVGVQGVSQHFGGTAWGVCFLIVVLFYQFHIKICQQHRPKIFQYPPQKGNAQAVIGRIQNRR